MSQSHVIRLRSRWKQRIARDTLTLARSFNCPTGLDGTQQVWIVIDQLPASGMALLNDKPLGPLVPKKANEFEVTMLLIPRNEVCLELRNLPGDEPLTEPTAVRLEIRTSS